MMLLRRSISHPSVRRCGGSRSFSEVSATKSPLASDGRHEIWREGQSSDHDNEPRYVNVLERKKLIWVVILLLQTVLFGKE
jgi:hypothetical protein